MTETAAAPATPAQASPKKAAKKAGGAKKPTVAKTHPPTESMVKAAIKALKERNGSSLQAIKKYIAANYKCDVEKQSIYIRKYLKSAVTKGVLVQTKGTGASGSFKIKDKKAEASAVKKPKVKKPKTAKKPKAAGAKKPKTPKKVKPAKKVIAAAPAEGQAAAPVKPKKVAKPKAAPKVKKIKKAPTAKKSPKPKKATKPKAKPAKK